MNLMNHLRQTGRTTSMLMAARRHSVNSVGPGDTATPVTIYAKNSMMRKSIIERIMRLDAQHPEHRNHNATVQVIPKGTDLKDIQDYMKKPDVFLDHDIIECELGPYLKELHRWDNTIRLKDPLENLLG